MTHRSVMPRPQPVSVLDLRMKALTVHQPFAWAIGHDRRDLPRKPWENRSQPTKYRGPVLIHAAERPPVSAYEVNVEAIFTMGGPEIGMAVPPHHQANYSGFVAIALITDCEFVTQAKGPISRTSVRTNGKTREVAVDGWRIIGSYAWRLEDITPLPFAPYSPGFLGFWTVDPFKIGRAGDGLRAEYQEAWDRLAVKGST